MAQLKIKISALTVEDAQRDPRLAKYFFVNNKHLDRFHIPEITAEEFEGIAKNFAMTARFDKKNLKYASATPYYIRKARVMKVAEDLGIAPNLIDTRDYIWDERYYTEYSFIRNIDVVDEAWRENGDDLRDASSYTVYCAMDAQGASIDIKLFDELYKFCYKAVVTRKAMLLCKVDKCIGFLQSVIAYTNGFADNITSMHRATLQSYIQFFTELLSNKEAAEYISSANDVKVFGDNEDTHKDYIESYRLMLKGLTKCRNEDLEFYRTDMSQVEDPYLDEILSGDDEPEEILSSAYIA
jgi:hypothetical protein